MRPIYLGPQIFLHILDPQKITSRGLIRGSQDPPNPPYGGGGGKVFFFFWGGGGYDCLTILTPHIVHVNLCSFLNKIKTQNQLKLLPDPREAGFYEAFQMLSFYK